MKINKLYDMANILNEYSSYEMKVNLENGNCEVSIQHLNATNKFHMSNFNEADAKDMISRVQDPYAKYAMKMIWDYGFEVKVIKALNYCGEEYTGFKINGKEYIDYVEDIKAFYGYCVRDILTKDQRRETFNRMLTPGGRRGY